VLENVPSVNVDMDGNVSLRGNANVRILVDGKPSGLVGISSAAVLDQLPANSIERIEVITNPSARYDAEGIVGIINIILKKEKRKGFNGFTSLSIGYPHNHQGSFNFNYRRKKFNLFGYYALRYKERPGIITYKRETTVNDTTTYLDQEGSFDRGGISNSIRLGLDYFINDKNSITGSIFYRISDKNNTRETEYRNYDFNHVLTNIDIRDAMEIETDASSDIAVNYKKTFDEKGRVLTADLQYSIGFEDEEESIEEQSYNLDLTPDLSDPLIQRSISHENQANLVIQTDYVHPIKNKGRIEVGYKSNFKTIDLEYDIEEFNDSTNTWDYLAQVSNHFVYDEMIHAAYFIYGRQMGKYGLQLGIRGEQTDITSTLEETGESSNKNYFSFFPSLHAMREIGEGHELQISYSRRIRRPSFWNLTPFTSYADPLNLWVGNPNLDPEFTHSIEIGNVKYSKQSTFSTSIYYRHTSGVIQRIRVLNEDGISITKPENLSTRQSFGIELTLSVKPSKWWRLNGSFNYFRSIVDGRNINSTFTSDFYGNMGRLSSNMTLWKDLDMQVMFNYRGPRETTQGEMHAMYFVDIGMKKAILKEDGSISIRMSDVGKTRKYSGETYGPGFYIQSEYSRWTRVIYLGFTYKFNKYKSRDRKRNYNGEMEQMEF